MTFLLIFGLFMQTNTEIYTTMPQVTIDEPALSVTAQGKAISSVKASEYKLILYADTYSAVEDEAREDAEKMRQEIIEITKKVGGKEEDVVLTNVNTLEPIEDDPYYRVEQDVQIWLRNINEINRIKEQFLLIDGVQIGSLTPIVSGTSDYGPAVKKAREDAIENAREQASGLASQLGVKIGDPLYVAEQVSYPTYSGYETSEESSITVTITIYYRMVHRK